MMDLKCLKEQIPDMTFSMLFLGIGVFFTLIGSIVLPIIGFMIGFLAVLFGVPVLIRSFNPECVYREQ